MASPLQFGTGKPGEGKGEAKGTVQPAASASSSASSSSNQGRREQKGCLTRTYTKFNTFCIWFRPYLSPVLKGADLISSSLAFVPNIVSGYASSFGCVNLLGTHGVEHADRAKERVEATTLDYEYKELKRVHSENIAFKKLQPPEGYGVKNSCSIPRGLSMGISLGCAMIANGYLIYVGFFTNDYKN